MVRKRLYAILSVVALIFVALLVASWTKDFHDCEVQQREAQASDQQFPAWDVDCRWQAAGDGAEVVFIALTTLATIFIAWFTITLSRSTEEQVRHNVAVERGYVQMRAEPARIEPVVMGGNTDYMVKIVVKNFGNTPALVTDAPMYFAIRNGEKPLNPTDLEFPDYSRGNTAFLVAGESFSFYCRIKREKFDPSGELSLWVYGYVDYETLGRRYRSGWARWYKRLRENAALYGGVDTDGYRNRETLVLVANDPNNYDKERE